MMTKTRSPAPPVAPAELVRVFSGTILVTMRRALAAIFLLGYCVASIASLVGSEFEEGHVAYDKHAHYNKDGRESMGRPEEFVLAAVEYTHGRAQTEINIKSDLEAGHAAYNEGDYEAAFFKYRNAAKRGHANAQFTVGFMSANGTGVPKNDATAIIWYIKAAEQGHASAQNNLGIAYKSGKGVLRDYERAVHWFTKAAAQDHAMAQINLGMSFATATASRRTKTGHAIGTGGLRTRGTQTRRIIWASFTARVTGLQWMADGRSTGSPRRQHKNMR